MFPFTRDDYRHVLLRRIGRICLVERTWIGDGQPHLPHFEVVRLRLRKARTLPDGHVIHAGEGYPGAHRWGSDGWSYPTLAHARPNWRELCPEDTDFQPDTTTAWTPLTPRERRHGCPPHPRPSDQKPARRRAHAPDRSPASSSSPQPLGAPACDRSPMRP